MYELAHEWHRESDNAVWVALDAVDEPGPLRIDRERAGHAQGLAGGDVRVDFFRLDVVGEVHNRSGCSPHGPSHLTPPVIDQPVARVQYAAAATLSEPALAGDGGLVRLAVHNAVELERRVAA